MPDAAAVRAFRASLGAATGWLDDAERVERLRALEELKSSAAAAQAVLAAELDASVRAERAAKGVPKSEQGRGIAAQVALARQESPAKGGRLLGLAKALCHEMPHTFAALRAGRLSEWRATLIVRETACLSVEDRAAIDEVLCADPATLDGVGDAALVAKAKALAYRLDPEAVVRRAARAEADRRVTTRPVPDTMARLSALLPVAQGVAAHAALSKAADEARAAGDPRTRGQVMADTLVERLTGQSCAGDVTVGVRLVMTERSLLGGDEEPAVIPGYGPVPAAKARDLVRQATERAGRVWLRRLFTHPSTGELIAMDARSRCFPAALREFLTLRDQTCRTPWCDAPIRHIDHTVPAARGGPTSAVNGAGLCERCNYDKEADGWRARAAPPGEGEGDRGGHVIETTTPTGHTYSSRPPPMPGAA